MSVLVIEDSNDDFEVLKVCLRAARVRGRIDRCSTGPEVAAYLENAKSLPLSQRPSLIFLDLNIPGGDGRKLLPKLRQHPTLSLVPIIILTTSAQPQDIETCYRGGAAGYLVKPLNLDVFEDKVQRVCDYWLDCVHLPELSTTY